MRLFVSPRRFLFLLGALGLMAFLGVYLERKAITRRFADTELAARKIDAHFDITAVGLRTQRFENVEIGDPAFPDLKADWVEAELGLGVDGIRIRSLRAGRVELSGRYSHGKLTFGALDKLFSPSTGKPFVLPDMMLSVLFGQAQLDTNYGHVRMQLNGDGNLANGFKGRLVVTSPSIRTDTVSADGLDLRLAIETENRRVAYSGAAKFLGATRTRPSGPADNDLGEVALRFRGDASETFDEINTSWNVIAPKLRRLRYGAATQLHADGKFTGGGADRLVTAQIRIDGAKPTAAEQTRLASLLPTSGGTPAEPLARQVRTAIARLEAGGTMSLPVEYRSDSRHAALSAGPPNFVSLSGARLVGSGRGLLIPLDQGRASFDGVFGLAGGGFPTGTMRLSLIDGGWAGTARFQPYATGGARLALSPIEFRYGRAGLGLKTVAMLDGPLGSGRVTGLRVPIALRPGRDPLSGCFAPGFRAADLAGLHLAPAVFRLCLSGVQANLSAFRLNGRLGDSPVQIGAQGLRLGLAHGDFAIGNAAVRLGPPDRLTLLDLQTLSGRFGKGRASGVFSGASGKIGKVPLRISEGRGDWQFAHNALRLTGGIRVADMQSDPRFNPLVSDDVVLHFSDNRITVDGKLRESKTLTGVADVHIVHDLKQGSGSAALDVPGLVFGRQLQPEMLTNITLGVIANAVGKVTGQGMIRWTPDGVTSTGAFRSDNMDLAAAFGPVTGLQGEITLSDLLGVETGPGQSVRIASINPGIAVLNGAVQYQLLPHMRARIEGGRWPFAGGWLILEPTTFDLSHAAERRLTFRVEGLDAGQFINQLQFENISATGVYDGVLPMIFDQNGGRIEGGHLVARNGGTLAYVGEISNQNLGTMGRIAFDALKSIRYDRLSIDLGGPIDGDVVTRISFAGVNQAPITGVRAKLPIPIRVTGLDNFPFIFNVTITAPFRKLFDMSRTISDPSLLIERLNPRLQRIGPAKTIQPSESEPVRKER